MNEDKPITKREMEELFIKNNSGLVTKIELREELKIAFEENNSKLVTKIELKELLKEQNTEMKREINDLALIVSRSFILVDKRFDKMEARFNQVDEKLNGMNSRIIGINNRIDDIAMSYVRREEHKKLEKRINKLELHRA